MWTLVDKDIYTLREILGTYRTLYWSSNTQDEIEIVDESQHKFTHNVLKDANEDDTSTSSFYSLDNQEISFL